MHRLRVTLFSNNAHDEAKSIHTSPVSLSSLNVALKCNAAAGMLFRGLGAAEEAVGAPHLIKRALAGAGVWCTEIAASVCRAVE